MRRRLDAIDERRRPERRAWIIHFGPWGRMEKWHPRYVAARLSGRWREALGR
jgi:hypothetical protein